MTSAGRIRRLAILLAMALAGINIVTGAPLLGLWVGSRVQGDSGGISIASLFAVVLTMLAVCLLLVRALTALEGVYERAAGHPPRRRRQTTWLRASSGDRPHVPGREPLTALDVVLIVVVVLAVVAFEIWFFLYSGSPFDMRSGRDG